MPPGNLETRTPSSYTLGAILVLISSLAFGTLALFAKRSYEAGFGQVTLLAIRFGVATLCLAIAVLVTKPKWPTRKQTLGLLLMGGFFIGRAFSFFAALSHLPASMASLLLYLYPGIVTVGSVFLFREVMTKTKWLALVLALSGSVLMVGVSTEGNPVGIAFGLAAALFYSAYLLAGYRFLQGIDPLAASLIVMATAAVTYAILAAIQGFQFPAKPEGWGWAISLGIVPTFIAISAMIAGLPRVGLVVASTLAAVDPLTTAVLSMLVLGERIGGLQALGGGCILAAVIVLARAQSPKPGN